MLLMGQAQPDPGQHNKGGGSAPFERAGQLGKKPGAALGPHGDLEVDDHHPDKGKIAGQIKTCEA